MPEHSPVPENSSDFYTPPLTDELEHRANLETFASRAEEPTAGVPSRQGGHTPHPPTPPSPDAAAADRMLAAEAQARGLSLGDFRAAMRARATDPAHLARLDAMLAGTPDPVTGQRIPLKPETWLAAWGDVANRGYGRAHQSLDVTSGGEALVPGVIFLPVPVPLPGPGSDDVVELDEGADLNPLRLLPAGDARRDEAGREVSSIIAEGRESGQLPR